MSDEQLWKTRFHQLMVVRLGSLAIFVVGIATIYTDVVREGGAPRVGAVLVIIGAITSLLAPKMLKKAWKRP